MGDNLELAHNQMQAMRATLRQFKNAASAASPQPDKIDKLKSQFAGLESKVSKLMEQGAGREWEPLKREAKQIRDEFQRLDRAVATKAANTRSSTAGDDEGPGQIQGGGHGGGKSLGLGTAQVVNTAPLDTEEALQRERLQGVVEIESQMGELKSMYQDFNTMVHDQQAGLDITETNVDKSTKHVERGVVELKKAGEVQKSSRKWMCVLLVIIVVAIAVGVGVFLATKG